MIYSFSSSRQGKSLERLSLLSNRGMLIFLIVWAEPKRSILGIYASEPLGGFLALLPGRAAGSSDCRGRFLDQHDNAYFQSTVAPDVQGWVFSIRRLIAFSITPLAYALASLAERFFEPWMSCAACYPRFSVLHPRIRNLESELPDAVEISLTR